MRLLLLSFSLCLATQGQGFDYANLPFLGAGNANNPLTTNLALHWVHGDLSLNSFVSIWTDRIQHANITNGTLSTQPFETSSGVYFASNSVVLWSAPLNDAAFASFTNPVSMALIYQFPPLSVGTSGFEFNDGAPTGTFQNNGGGIDKWRVFKSGLGTFDATGSLPSNVPIDWTSGKLSNSTIVYTNGVVDTVGGAGGSGGGGAIPSLNCDLFGQVSVNTFYVMEMFVWTNQATTAVLASNLTYYRRTTYGGP